MIVAVLYNRPLPGCGAEELDTMVQVRAVSETLRELGHGVYTVPFSLDLPDAAATLRALRPDIVFNLAEGADGKGRFIHFAPALLEDLGLPFTGADSTAMAVSSNKLMAKAHMRSAGLPTPPWRTLPQLDSGEREARGTFIIKSVWEHASIGLEGDCVVEVRSAAALMDAMLRLRGRMGGECFAERFLDGHEYCVAMLDSPNGPQALPPARMRFGGGTGSERVIGYRAKWDEEAPEYDLVRRDFDSCAADAALCRDLTSTALACWKAFGLSGYARVDFRTGAHGEVNIIDINANPCLSPDAGFAAALERAGIPYADAVRRILEAALVWHDAGRSVRRK